jgi:short-subunit dehydrogenase
VPHIEIVIANAAVGHDYAPWAELVDIFRGLTRVNLTGVRKSARITTPTLIQQGDGGSIVIIGPNRG